MFNSGGSWGSGTCSSSTGWDTTDGFPDGTEENPAIFFTSAPNTGFYNYSSGTIAFANSNNTFLAFSEDGIATPAVFPLEDKSIEVFGKATNEAESTGVKIGNENTLSVTNSKIVGFYSDKCITEKASIDKDGCIAVRSDGDGMGIKGNGIETGIAFEETVAKVYANGERIVSIDSDGLSVDKINIGSGDIENPSIVFEENSDCGLSFGTETNPDLNVISTSIDGVEKMSVNENGVNTNKINSLVDGINIKYESKVTNTIVAIGHSFKTETALTGARARMASFNSEGNELAGIDINGAYYQKLGFVTTYDDTETEVLLLPIDADKAYNLSATVVGADINGEHIGAFKFEAVVRKKDGVITILDNIFLKHYSSYSGWSADIIASDENNAAISVTGVNDMTIRWKAILTYLQIGGNDV